MRKGLILFLAVISFFLVAGCGKKQEKAEKECESITGGSFDLIFVTNNDETVPSMSVCIACPPDTYEDLPVLESEDKEFEGWYYDADFTKKVEVTNSKDITPVPNDPKCVTDYNDITLYAKWTENAE